MKVKKIIENIKRRTVNNIFKNKEGSTELIVMVILCVIAVGLSLVYKEQVGKLITDIISSAQTKISGMLG